MQYGCMERLNRKTRSRNLAVSLDPGGKRPAHRHTEKGHKKGAKRALFAPPMVSANSA
jgi:hypothetical protein